jgi:hypothetical protein
LALLIPFLFIASTVVLAGLNPTGEKARPTAQDDSRGREFVAAAKRGDENAVRKALEEDVTLVHATDVLNMTALDWLRRESTGTSSGSC